MIISFTLTYMFLNNLNQLQSRLYQLMMQIFKSGVACRLMSIIIAGPDIYSYETMNNCVYPMSRYILSVNEKLPVHPVHLI